MQQQNNTSLWHAFTKLNRHRRAIRDFNGTPVPDDDVREILTEAMQAPSSVNLQPYEFHWVKDPVLKKRMVAACNGQRAASSAGTLIFVVASPDIARKTAEKLLAYIDTTDALPERSKDFHRKTIKKLMRVLTIGTWPIWSPIVSLVTLLRPSMSLLPLGHLGSRSWAARNANLASQTLMLAASAKGIDSCPMEGFSASKVAAILGLPRGAVVPVAIALGYRTDDARTEPQWRRALADVIVEH